MGLLSSRVCISFCAAALFRAVGEAGSMKDVVEAQWRAEKVITL